MAAADGLKKGEQQILNLNYVQPELREKINDFLCGVKHISEGDWVELGENVYLLTPASAYVELAESENSQTRAMN